MGMLSTLEKERSFVEKQKVFFVASAPLSRSCRVNVSPKSAKEFKVVDNNTVGYLDLTGKSFLPATVEAYFDI